MSKKTCLIVGNADLQHDHAAEIDSADIVLRFNEPRNVGGKSGLKTTNLMLCNSGKPMQTKLDNNGFLNSVFFQTTPQLTLVYHPDIIKTYFKQPLITSRLFKGRKRDWTKQAIEKLGSYGKEISILPPQFYLQACAEINIETQDLYKIFPSTGYLGMQYYLQKLDLENWTIKITGFGFEGWKRHAWDAERHWVEAQIAQNKLQIL